MHFSGSHTFTFIIDMLPKFNSSCQDCWNLDPPPDMILTIPPPPMPTFFAGSFITANNRSNVPCSLLCDWTTGQGMEMTEELSHTGKLVFIKNVKEIGNYKPKEHL